MTRLSYLLFISIIILLSNVIIAQDEPNTKIKNRPTIGLVLSGGGAKGFAHIGVLKVFEEYGIRPDYISGTSMGSLVAALYSLGYSAEQLETIITNADWNDLLTDKITLRDIPIFEKEDYPGYPLRLSLNDNGKLTLPSGMIKGQKIQSLFAELVWSSNQYPNFDAFPIPYRCVATDIISGQAIVFEDGNLADAMRSSMSIPTVFTPVELDTLLLVDGGVVKNFPVQECIDMGADLIIGVYTGFDEHPKKEDMGSMIKILARSSAVQGIVDARTQAEKTDLFIIPDLSKFGADNFNKSTEIIAAGELAARDSLVIIELKKISKLRDPIEIVPGHIESRGIRINKISVEGSNRIDSLTIIKMSQLENETDLNAKDIDEGIKKIYASWQFEKVSYRIEKEKDETILVLRVEEGSRGNVNLGVHYDNSYGPNALFRVAYNDLFLKSTRASTNLSVSANPRMRLNYKYYPTKRRRIELALNSYFQINKMRDIITQDSLTISLGHYMYSHADFNLSLAWSPFRNTMLKVSGGKQFNKIKLKEGMDTYYNISEVNYKIDFYKVEFNVNTLDDPFFPTRGAYFNMDFKYSFNSNINESDTSVFLGNLSKIISTFTFEYKQYFLIKKRFSIIPEFTFGIQTGKAFLTEKFFLGGFTYNNRPNSFNCGGIRSNYVATDNFLLMGIGGQYKIFKNWFVQMGVQALVFVDYAEFQSETEEEFEDNTFSGWRIGIGHNSRIGPLRLIVSKSEERNEYEWALNIGVPF